METPMWIAYAQGYCVYIGAALYFTFYGLNALASRKYRKEIARLEITIAVLNRTVDEQQEQIIELQHHTKLKRA
jgi:hypothetical protein